MGTEARRAGERVHLPHVVVVVVLGCKDDTCRKGADVELDLDLIVGDFRLLAAIARSIASYLYPACRTPYRVVANPSLEVCPLGARSFVTLVVCYRHLPVVAGARAGGEALCQDVDGLARTDLARLPYDILEITVSGDPYLVRFLNYATLVGSENPTEVRRGNVYPNGIAVCLRLEVAYLKGKRSLHYRQHNN